MKCYGICLEMMARVMWGTITQFRVRKVMSLRFKLKFVREEEEKALRIRGVLGSLNPHNSSSLYLGMKALLLLILREGFGKLFILFWQSNWTPLRPFLYTFSKSPSSHNSLLLFLDNCIKLSSYFTEYFPIYSIYFFLVW